MGPKEAFGALLKGVLWNARIGADVEDLGTCLIAAERVNERRSTNAIVKVILFRSRVDSARIGC